MIAVCVDPKKVNEVFPTVAPMLREAMQRGDLGVFQDIEDAVLDGSALLWLAWDGRSIFGACVTQLLQSESGKFCLIAACGGREVSKWIGLIEKIEDYAKKEQCRCTRIMGRKGWARLLDSYRATRIVLEKELN